MTLQERLKASAKELVRLLEEDIANIEKLRDEARETAAAYTGKDKAVPRVVKLALEEMGIKPVEVKLDNGKEFERKEFGECECPICRSIQCGQAPEMIAIPLENGKELRYELVKPCVESSGHEPLRDKMLAELRRDQGETTRLKNRFQVMAENMRVQAHLERILAAIPVPTKDVIFIGIKGRVFAYDLMNEDGFRRMEQGEYEHIYKVVADGDSNRVIKISTEPEAEK